MIDTTGSLSMICSRSWAKVYIIYSSIATLIINRLAIVLSCACILCCFNCGIFSIFITKAIFSMKFRIICSCRNKLTWIHNKNRINSYQHYNNDMIKKIIVKKKWYYSRFTQTSGQRIRASGWLQLTYLHTASIWNLT